ncbi:Lactam utilization protein lamB [Leucoagaricus sp. SymC.cos]|nr:Lactam utilization protein lamB [Leucoagaricus sp. SymC.cos]
MVKPTRIINQSLYLAMVTWMVLKRLVPAVAQNLTEEQVAIISQRLAEGAQKSWELGTRTQTILEVNATLYSVFSRHAVPPPSTPPGNLTAPLELFFAIPRTVVADRTNASENASEPQPLIPGDGASADPASIGMSVSLANWTGQADGSGLDFAGAARGQLDFLLNVVPRTPDGAISHRVSGVQLWSDFVYMVPPFLAYYGVVAQNRTLLLEAYNQIKLYRNYLRDSDAQNRWKHVLLGQSGLFNDEGHWTTGNGWAAAGMLRVLATMENSQYANTLNGQRKDLGNWVKEIHDGMYAVLNDSVNIWTNYPDVPVDSTGNFYDAAGTALLASTVFRGAVLLNQFTHVPAAERIRMTLFSPSSSPLSSSSTSSLGTTTSSTATPPSLFDNYAHLTTEGWLTPVVDPYSFGQQGSKSPESEAFILQLHSAWRDWVTDGARGANSGSSHRFDRLGNRNEWWMWLVAGGWMWVVCGGEGYSLYRIADDEQLMKTIHLANVACGFHASDFDIMNQTVEIAKANYVNVGAHPSLPDKQGFGRREMKLSPEELFNCFTYQTGALTGFLKVHGMELHHIKPHGAIYGQMARDLELAKAGVRVCKVFSPADAPPGAGVAFVGLAGTMHEVAAKEEGVRFIPEWFSDLAYDETGKLLITKTHEPVSHEVITERVNRLLKERLVTTRTAGHYLPFTTETDEVTICVHSDTPASGDS